jgi:hypothetical protein
MKTRDRPSWRCGGFGQWVELARSGVTAGRSEIGANGHPTRSCGSSLAIPGRAAMPAFSIYRMRGPGSSAFPGFHGAPRPVSPPFDLLEIQKSQHFAEEGLRVAERLEDAARLVGAHMALAGRERRRHCSPQSSAGLPKGSIRPTSKRPRRCSTNSPSLSLPRRESSRRGACTRTCARGCLPLLARYACVRV